MKKLFSVIAAVLSWIGMTYAQLPEKTVSGIVTDPFGLTAPEQSRDRQAILDHPVKLKDGKLQPWTSYDTIILHSMNFIKRCPAKDTPDGPLPWYLITARLNQDGSFHLLQNNQGSNFYWAMETFKRYYPYTGDRAALEPVRQLAERIALFLTPGNFEWSGVPRTQDDTPDGVYDDDKGEPDKAAMVAAAYVDYARFTGESRYLAIAEGIAKTLLAHVRDGSADESPLPFRVNLRTGETIRTEGHAENYTSNMIMVVKMIDALLSAGTSMDRDYLMDKKRQVLGWILKYPMKTNLWACYFEDVKEVYRGDNVNQFSPMETARYLMENPGSDSLYKEHVTQLIYFVKNRFGYTRRYGATSVGEQDACIGEMGSHTARYASVVGKWSALSNDSAAREEARASFALAAYSACNKYTKGDAFINYTGIGFLNPWFSDSYFDYLSHFLEGFEDLPELMPEGSVHLFSTTSMIRDVTYLPDGLEYSAADDEGTELIKLDYIPQVYADGELLPEGQWSFGRYRGVANILKINRKGTKSIKVRKLRDCPPAPEYNRPEVDMTGYPLVDSLHFPRLFSHADCRYAWEGWKGGFRKWQKSFRRDLEKKLGLTGIKEELSNFKPSATRIDCEDLGTFTRERWEILTEPDILLPIVVLRPKDLSGKVPLMITPHGHSGNTELYAGVYWNEEDWESAEEGERNIAVQAVGEGFIAIAPTARGFGKTRWSKDIDADSYKSCGYYMLRDAMVGRTLIGDRVWDIMKIIDWALAELPVDPSKVMVSGHSGGGTATLYAGAVDERIAVCMPSGAFSSFEKSIVDLSHCECNYVPGIMELGNMGDIAGLVAGRQLLIIQGKEDDIFPIDGAREEFARTQKIFSSAGKGRCGLAEGDGGHRYYKAPAWKFVHEWLGTHRP